MNAKIWLALLGLVGGIPLAAWGLAKGVWLAAIVGLALVLAFVYVAMIAITKVNEPQRPITPAANSVWGMKDEPRAPPPPANDSEQKP